MKSSIYWMLFQILIGIWLLFSPVVLGLRELKAIMVNDMVLGGIVIVIGIAMIVYDFYQGEDSERMSEELHSGTQGRKKKGFGKEGTGRSTGGRESHGTFGWFFLGGE